MPLDKASISVMSFHYVRHRLNRLRADVCEAGIRQAELWAAALTPTSVTTARRDVTAQTSGQSSLPSLFGAVICCGFGGHEDKIVTRELESGYDETEVQP